MPTSDTTDNNRPGQNAGPEIGSRKLQIKG